MIDTRFIEEFSKQLQSTLYNNELEKQHLEDELSQLKNANLIKKEKLKKINQLLEEIINEC